MQRLNGEHHQQEPLKILVVLVVLERFSIMLVEHLLARQHLLMIKQQMFSL